MMDEGQVKSAPKRWSAEEEELLVSGYLAGQSLAELAEAHGRSEGAIRARLHLLDLILYGPYNSLLQGQETDGEGDKLVRQGHPWTGEEETALREVHRHMPTPEALATLALRLERTPKALVLKLAALGEIEVGPNPHPQPQPRTPAPKKADLPVPKAKAVAPAPVTETGPSRTVKIKVTPEFQTALRAIEAGENLLVLGSAGTGKSTFLKWLRKQLENKKKYAILAPTGMAALQVGGQTIHSFFGLKAELYAGGSKGWHKPRNPKLFSKLELIILDEISMVRADVFEAMDQFLRRYGPLPHQPFGGVQVVALGDLFQLPPVVTSAERGLFRQHYASAFFFASNAWQQGDFGLVMFTQIFRQSDAPFIRLLDRVRTGDKSADLLAALNTRVTNRAPDGAVVLAARNRTVDELNQQALTGLPGRATTYTAKLSGSADAKAFTTPVELSLKEGARVMFTRNDPTGRWVNGTLGTVTDCETNHVKVHLDEGKTVTVEPVMWEVTKYQLDEGAEAPVATVAGTFTQLPLTLAWALTIHKAQGQTLEKCVIDLSDGGAFSEGQLYVALSRARALDSLHLLHPVKARDIRTSAEVLGFVGIEK